ncbi:PepSY domain-containing protein [Streptomyces sp. NBC_00687]|uniref:PepSY-associated TM helix domain-containing protein n=1 Tax=Streptomyces sp. NBC_00687 TaxID=2975807 RepID=UPI00224E1FD6|nr:PepSY domain-containing protein [Streptomyces sp. NBC_00687]MCX4919340.1 PepSY domain-containing protein [Streptomyces sp. NBC_00687]
MSVSSEIPDLPGAGTERPESGVRPPAPAGRRTGLGALLVRLHFYAGVLVAPFLLVAAVTGLLYTFTPQLDAFVYDRELSVAHTGDSTRPLAGQVAAARARHPTGTLIAVRPGTVDATTQVDFALPELGEKAHTVYVDPYTDEVTGQLTTWYGSTPLTTWLDDLHRNLHLGTAGRYYSEFAASWLWVLVLGGLVLWWRRQRGGRTARRLLLPDRTAKPGVRRTRSLHAVTGLWLAVGLLALSATGLTWSRFAGEHFSQALDSLRSGTPGVSTTLSGSPAGAAGGHDHDEGGTDAHETGSVDPASVERVLDAARDDGLDGPVEIAVPQDDATAWTVSQTRNLWPVGRDSLAVDASTGEVVDRVDFADWPLLSKLTRWGINVHMGTLFGLANQVLLAVLAVGLICVIIWGYRMWWQRRPTRADRRAALGAPPARGAWRGVPSAGLAVGVVAVVALGWALPLFGVPLAAFLVVDLVTGVVRRRGVAQPSGGRP